VDYLSYLSDSVYYPARFDTVTENPVSSVGITISFDYDSQPSFLGYDETTMRSFSIGYSVCDPCCTAKYPLISMSFMAQSKSGLEFTSGNGKTYPTELGIWLEKYPERFFEYRHGDLTIYILCQEKNGVNAYFFDDTYFYSITSTYNQKYK
jgi:hypothetical protein